MLKIKRIWAVLALCLFVTSFLTACGLNTPTPFVPVAKPTTPTTPVAKTWLISDPTAFLSKLSLAPTATLQTPSAADATFQKNWEHPVTGWINQELDSIKRDRLSPPRAARALALLAVGLNDGLVVAEQASKQGTKLSEEAVLAGVAAPILAYIHPTATQQFNDLANQTSWIGVWQGRNSAAEVETGLKIGKGVSGQVLTFAAQDGADQPPNFTLPSPAPGIWQPTLPKYAAALEPGWGKVAVMGIPTGTEFAIAAPPAWNSPEFQQDRADFVAVQQKLTEADKALANKWAGQAGTVTPPGMWYEIARELILRDNLNNADSARIYSTMGVAVHAAFCSTWKVKYQYMVARPIQWMPEKDPNWKPVIDTPPFPSYPSGHATGSAAASTALSAFFPNDKTRLQQDAKDAAYSRIVGGIHWAMDSKAGLELGNEVGDFVLKQAQLTQK